MISYNLIFILLFQSPISFLDEFGKLKGVVLEHETNKPLSDVEITFCQLSKSIISSQDGSFICDSVPVGVYTIQFRKNGYYLLKKYNIRVLSTYSTVVWTILTPISEKRLFEYTINPHIGAIDSQLYVPDSSSCIKSK